MLVSCAHFRCSPMGPGTDSSDSDPGQGLSRPEVPQQLGHARSPPLPPQGESFLHVGAEIAMAAARKAQLTDTNKLYYTSNGPMPELAAQEEPFPEPDNQSKMKRSCENAEHVGKSGLLFSSGPSLGCRLTWLRSLHPQCRPTLPRRAAPPPFPVRPRNQTGRSRGVRLRGSNPANVYAAVKAASGQHCNLTPSGITISLPNE